MPKIRDQPLVRLCLFEIKCLNDKGCVQTAMTVGAGVVCFFFINTFNLPHFEWQVYGFLVKFYAKKNLLIRKFI